METAKQGGRAGAFLDRRRPRGGAGGGAQSAWGGNSRCPPGLSGADETLAARGRAWRQLRKEFCREAVGGRGEVPTWTGGPRSSRGGRSSTEPFTPGLPGLRQPLGGHAWPRGPSDTQQLALLFRSAGLLGQATSQSPPLVCARHTFPTSRIVSAIRPGPLNTYPCRPRLPWGPSRATLRTPLCGIMQTTEMEGDLGRLPGGGGICTELKRSKMPISWSAGHARALGHHGGWVRAPRGWGQRAHLWPSPAHTHPPAAALSTHQGWERVPEPREWPDCEAETEVLGPGGGKACAGRGQRPRSGKVPRLPVQLRLGGVGSGGSNVCLERPRWETACPSESGSGGPREPSKAL